MACKHRDLDEKFIGNPGELPMDPLWIEANMLNLGTGNFCFFFLENGENHPAKGSFILNRIGPIIGHPISHVIPLVIIFPIEIAVVGRYLIRRNCWMFLPRRSCLLGSPHLNLKLSSVVFDRLGLVKRARSGAGKKLEPSKVEAAGFVPGEVSGRNRSW